MGLFKVYMRSVHTEFNVEATTEIEAISIATELFQELAKNVKVDTVTRITPKTAAETKRDNTMHVCLSGDSLFGAREWACGDAEKIKGMGIFPEQHDQIHLVNCRKCMASQEYRDALKELGVEHPFSKAAKKAHATMTKNKLSKVVRNQYDDLRCACGNTPDAYGFFPCDEKGVEVEPTEEQWKKPLYKCDSCGLIINYKEVRIEVDPDLEM